MKINGQKYEARNSTIIPICRPSGTIYLIAEAIADMSAITKAMDEIGTTQKQIVGGKPGEALKPLKKNATNVMNEVKRYQQYVDGLVVHSLKYVAQDEVIDDEMHRVQHNFEWDLVDVVDPATWLLWRDDLKGSAFNPAEIRRVESGCLEANSLSDKAVEDAMNDFFVLPLERAETVYTSQVEHGLTQSGELAQESESDHQA